METDVATLHETDTEVCEICNITEFAGPLRLWALEFEITGVGKGTAIIKEVSSAAAENKLRHDGMFNSAPYLYKVTKVEEVIEPPCAALMAEEIVTRAEVCEGPYAS